MFHWLHTFIVVHRNRMKMLLFFLFFDKKKNSFSLFASDAGLSESKWTVNIRRWNVLNLHEITFNFYCQCYPPMITPRLPTNVCFFLTIQSQWSLPKNSFLGRTFSIFYRICRIVFGFNADSVLRQTCIGLLCLKCCSKLETFLNCYVKYVKRYAPIHSGCECE